MIITPSLPERAIRAGESEAKLCVAALGVL